MSKEKKPVTQQYLKNTEGWWDMLYERKERINKRLKALMDEETADLTPEMDEALRMQLTEETRFWR